jgi:RNA polymerase sigma-70 factor (ECF subfamily)
MIQLWSIDRRLVRRTLAGDKAAGEQLVTAHYPAVLRFLVHLTGKPVEAEELTQDTFVRAWQKLDTFQGASTFKTWLHRIAYREYANRRKLPDVVELDEELFEARKDFSSNIVEALAIERAIANLPEHLRSTFLICHVQEMSIAEAAEILNIPAGTVMSRLSIARERLRRQLTIQDVAVFAASREEDHNTNFEGPQSYEMSKSTL